MPERYTKTNMERMWHETILKSGQILEAMAGEKKCVWQSNILPFPHLCHVGKGIDLLNNLMFLSNYYSKSWG